MITPEWFRVVRWVVIALLVAAIGYFAARAYFSPSSVVDFGNLRMCTAAEGPAALAASGQMSYYGWTTV